MKKMILLLLALALALSGLAVYAQEETDPETTDLPETVILSGFVLDMNDEFILVKTADGLYVEALLTEETVFEGKDAAIGDLIHIAYNGMMTRSLPAQITAQHIGNYMLMGVVSELTESGFTLAFGEEIYQVNADAAQLEGIQDGMFITVYHMGQMTMSIPAQVSAAHIRGEEIVGIVTEMVEGGFTLTVEGEELPYHVAIMADALLFVQPEPGLEVSVVSNGLMTSSLESILINAVEVIPMPMVQEIFDVVGVVTEITGEFILIQTADGQLIQANLSEETFFEGKEIEVGDFVHVTYNGMMTFSIPAQIAAMKIGCYANTGVVGEIGEASFVLETDLEPVIVNATAEQLAGIQSGMTVTVYSNGAMTMSLPAQIGAEHITATEIIVD